MSRPRRASDNARVVWVSFAPLRKTAAGFSSDLASVRYRIILPARAIPGSKVTHIGPGANRRTLLERFDCARVVVLGKFFDAPVLELATALKARGIRVIADYSDDHFAHPVLGPAYRAVANAADRVVASTPGLAAVLKEHTSVPVHVITDPVEGARGEPRASEPPRLLRFGLPQLSDYSLTIMTAPGVGAALWAGRFVIAHPLPAYQPLAAFGWVGEDLGEGLAWFSQNEQEALDRIRAGQAWVAEHCSGEAIGRAWKTLIDAS